MHFASFSIPFQQIFLVEFGSIVFSCHPLHVSEWMWCLFFGVGSLLWQQIIAFIPASVIPKKFSFGRTPVEEPSIVESPEEVTDRADSRAELKRAQILWMRGLNRLQQQVWRIFRCTFLVHLLSRCFISTQAVYIVCKSNEICTARGQRCYKGHTRVKKPGISCGWPSWYLHNGTTQCASK